MFRNDSNTSKVSSRRRFWGMLATIQFRIFFPSPKQKQSQKEYVKQKTDTKALLFTTGVYVVMIFSVVTPGARNVTFLR
jgi:hypothetical protein